MAARAAGLGRRGSTRLARSATRVKKSAVSPTPIRPFARLLSPRSFRLTPTFVSSMEEEMPTTLEIKTPRLVTVLPGPNAKRVLEQDAKFMSPSYTRDYPLVAKRGHGAIVEDVDGNCFLEFAAGETVCSTGHCHPKVVAAIQKQAAELIHMSGTDFYYESMPQLAQRLGRPMPGAESK